jgi:hypothetical protein
MGWVEVLRYLHIVIVLQRQNGGQQNNSRPQYMDYTHMTSALANDIEKQEEIIADILTELSNHHERYNNIWLTFLY